MAVPIIAATSVDKTGTQTSDIVFTPATDGPGGTNMGFAVGSLALAHVGLCGVSPNAIVPPGDWTEIAYDSADGGNSVDGGWWYKIESDLPATYTFAVASTSADNGMSAKLFRIEGHHLTTPINATAEAKGTGLTGLTIPEFSTTVHDCLAIWSVALGDPNTVTTTWLLPELYDFGTAVLRDCSISAVSSARDSVRGGVGAVPMVFSENVNSVVGIGFAIAPAIAAVDTGRPGAALLMGRR